MCETALDAAHTRRHEEAPGTFLFVSRPTTNDGHGYLSTEVTTIECTDEDATAREMEFCTTPFYKLHGVVQNQDEDQKKMPRKRQWLGEKDAFFLREGFVKNMVSIPARFQFVVEGPKCKVQRRPLMRDVSDTTCESETPENDLINLLPDECLYEIFRSLSRAQDRRSVAGVCRRWLWLQSHMPRSSFKTRLASIAPLEQEATQTRIVRNIGRGGQNDRAPEPVAVLDEEESDLSRDLGGRKATDVRLASMAVGTLGRGGLGKLRIRGGPGMDISRAVSDEGMKAVGVCCWALRKLDLWHCANIGDEGLISIGRGCHRLERLNILKCPGIGDAGIRAVAEGCPLLSNISLDSCKRIGNEGLKSIGRSSSNLVSLSISNCEVGSEGIVAVVSSCLKLKEMLLEKVDLNDAGLGQVGEHLKSLVKLTLSNLKSVTEAGFLALGDSSSLQELRAMRVSACQGLSDNALNVVGESCKELRVFSLLNCEAVSDMGLQAFTMSCRFLESLHVEGCSGITQVGLKAALANRGGQLKALRLSNCSGVVEDGLTDKDVVQTCSVLKSLSITDCKRVGNDCLGMLVRSCPALEVLNLSGLSAVGDSVLKHLVGGAKRKLRELNLTGCVEVTDVGVCAVIQRCAENLKILSLEGCIKVSDKSMHALAVTCSGLEELDVSRCGITDDGLEAVLVENGAALKSLSLAGCEALTDKSLEALERLVVHDKFGSLNVKKCQGMSRKALDRFEMNFFNTFMRRT
ncbi:F-box and leucine-rich repeat protein 2/20 [Marchantia polymorpha subsp. ruderalis]|uniref:Uncharacterized protein n=1 Tax=Marchantia polymorpha TaxID=3197 RepID=A0A2R6XIX6_MARPO|nr:hypothetical protein MARPO_0013s0206 [Marchantia polymorpha]BBN18829.1 hypothetical protein Mp_8g05840 [Marchantia polymorpha subsp. ruderalis]|eukprot:PTQ46016.1 hypothetical protein MARPO_0013s0206 [Marchantia polymorpha]